MARLQYYYIRIWEDGKELATRCEKAKGPRQACKLAFGVIYDRDTDTAKYRELGGKRPGSLSGKRMAELRQDGPEWKPIPKTGD